MQNKPFSIAIDGPAGAGKSTMAKALAKSLDAMYLDTGAMYRAIGLYMLRRDAVNNAAAIAKAVEDVDIAVRYIDGAQHLFLGDEDVSQAIREPEVSMAASTVSAVPEVRERMVALQRGIAEGQNVVMDGRDIGTKVLPNATLKIYLTASAEERARRRCRELEEKGMPESYEKVLQDMIRRDYQDTHRAASPLQPAEDSVHVDSSNMTIDETVALMRRLAIEAIEKR
ncbi:MAG: (d)CMP kinase [Clostridia bacterium]|nr:(d)CMP kinase [Clostridia bacterium]